MLMNILTINCALCWLFFACYNFQSFCVHFLVTVINCKNNALSVQFQNLNVTFKNLKYISDNFDVFLTLHHKIDFFQLFVVRFLLGDSPASDLYMPTFRNTLSVPIKMKQIECSETSAYINQAPGNHPKENTQHSEHGESLQSRIVSITNLMHNSFIL